MAILSVKLARGVESGALGVLARSVSDYVNYNELTNYALCWLTAR